MIRGIYATASGMNAEELEQDIVANNVANATTVGFKKDAPVFEAFPNRLLQRIHDRMDASKGAVPAVVAANTPVNAYPLGYVGQGVKSTGTVTQFTPGNVTSTNQPLDLAIEGNGLFTIQRADGSTQYTRAGNFTVNSDKQLVTQDGDLVVGKNGQPISLDGTNVVIDLQGGVHVDGNDSGQIQMVTYDPARFEKAGENRWVKQTPDFEAVSSEPGFTGSVRQGFLEQSNVEIVTEMVHMISLMRAYEANTKIITVQDESLSQLMTNVGTPSA